MPFHNFPAGINDSPLVKSVFVQNYSEGGDFPPPGSEIMITEDDIIMVCEDGTIMITE